jgi:hypothetical protein
LEGGEHGGEGGGGGDIGEGSCGEGGRGVRVVRGGSVDVGGVVEVGDFIVVRVVGAGMWGLGGGDGYVRGRTYGVESWFSS